MPKYKKTGFTLVELIVVIAILMVIFTFATINIFTVKSRASMNAAVDTFVSDLKEQQLRAMVSDTGTGTTPDSYGILFDDRQYVLFLGSIYSPSNTTNFIVANPDNIDFSVNSFPSSQIIFQRGSGEIADFVAGQNTITIRNTNTNEQKIVSINRYGVITSIN